MAAPQATKPRKGLNAIRTMSDLLTETSNPQKKFLKLAMLAMEKVRRGKERESARRRIGDIDGRMAEIKAEKRALLELVNAANAKEESAGGALREACPDRRLTSKEHPRAMSRRAEGGLKFRY